jgi:hypothetical protein
MNTTIKYGLTAGLAYIVFTLALYLLGMEKSQGIGMIGYLILLGAQFLGVKEMRDSEMNGFITFGTAWKKGLLIALTAGILASIYMAIHLNYINPEIMQEILDETESQMEANGNSSAEIEMGMKMAHIFTNPWMTSVFTFLGFILIGMLLSLLPAAILKNETPESPLE